MVSKQSAVKAGENIKTFSCPSFANDFNTSSVNGVSHLPNSLD